MLLPLDLRIQPIEERLSKRIKRFQTLLEALNQKELNIDVKERINEITASLNQYGSSDPKLGRKLSSAYNKVLSIAEKNHGYVPPRTHFVRWMAIGMTAFGVPLGVTMGLAMDNMAFLGVFIGVGLSIGLAIGISLDKKAVAEGKVLDVAPE